MSDIIAIQEGQVGFITLNRPKALNALSLSMIRDLSGALLGWRADASVKAVAIRGMSKDAASPTGNRPFGALCAGGDIRFFHQAALAGDPALEDFFTEEYALNHLIHTFPKPTVIFMDGIVMGGGMGLCGHGRNARQSGSNFRLVTPQSKLAMPETYIGLFPDVGGGHFLSRCPGSTGEWLGLTGAPLNAGQALQAGLADAVIALESQAELWAALATADLTDPASLQSLIATKKIANYQASTGAICQFDSYFSLNSVLEVVQALEACSDPAAQQTATTLRGRSPLMLHVTWAQIRRARSMSIADELRMERNIIRHCFHPHHLNRSGAATDTVEGIRALVIDKDHTPKWNPAQIEDVTPEMVEPYFASPWPASAHPLKNLV
jgi:enoyl-CoA hydratase/carnithine racemase